MPPHIILSKQQTVLTCDIKMIHKDGENSPNTKIRLLHLSEYLTRWVNVQFHSLSAASQLL